MTSNQNHKSLVNYKFVVMNHLYVIICIASLKLKSYISSCYHTYRIYQDILLSCLFIITLAVVGRNILLIAIKINYYKSHNQAIRSICKIFCKLRDHCSINCKSSNLKLSLSNIMNCGSFFCLTFC